MRRIHSYNGVDIVVYDQSLFIPPGTKLWLERPVTDQDILAAEALIDCGRNAMAREIKSLCDQLKKLGAT